MKDRIAEGELFRPRFVVHNLAAALRHTALADHANVFCEYVGAVQHGVNINAFTRLQIACRSCGAIAIHMGAGIEEHLRLATAENLDRDLIAHPIQTTDCAPDQTDVSIRYCWQLRE